MKIAVVGTGYVGLWLATLLAQHHSVVAVDVVRRRFIRGMFFEGTDFERDVCGPSCHS